MLKVESSEGYKMYHNVEEYAQCTARECIEFNMPYKMYVDYIQQWNIPNSILSEEQYTKLS